jgi:hypothetical protein
MINEIKRADCSDMLTGAAGISSKKLPTLLNNSTVSTAGGSNLSMFSKKVKVKPNLKILVKDPSPKNLEINKSNISCNK